MDPIIKYRGGKSREIKRFGKYIPPLSDFDVYFEPFLGGGAVYFYLEPEKAILNDINSKLMSFYNEVRNSYDDLKSQLTSIQSEYDENQDEYMELKRLHPDDRVPNKNEMLYYTLRDMYNGKIESQYSPGALYYFINKTAYSGMIRFNSKGEYNVPFGRYPNFNTKLITPNHSKLLNKATLYNTDYSEIFHLSTENDFMFLDPPYDCVFNDYGNIDMMNGFDEKEHRRLAEDYKKLQCKALMVIGKTDLTEELYSDYIVDEYYKNYSVNIRNRFKADAKHIVVANYDI